MFNWLKEYLELKSEYGRRCESCETLKTQLNIANFEKEKLLNRILQTPEPVEQVVEAPKISVPSALPWKVRRQLLEAEDRKAAQLMRDAPKPSPVKTHEVTLNALDKVEEKELDKLERELGVVEGVK